MLIFCLSGQTPMACGISKKEEIQFLNPYFPLIKWQACKPGSVILSGSFIIYLFAAYPSWYPVCCRKRNGPSRSTTTAVITRIYLALQPVSRTADHVAMITGGLLTRLFTRSPDEFSSIRDGCFLLRCYPLSKISLTGSTVPCVARTFLSSAYFRRNDKAACRCKISENN